MKGFSGAPTPPPLFLLLLPFSHPQCTMGFSSHSWVSPISVNPVASYKSSYINRLTRTKWILGYNTVRMLLYSKEGLSGLSIDVTRLPNCSGCFFLFFFHCSCSVEVCQELISLISVTPLYVLSVICVLHRATFFSVRKRVPDTVLI